MILGADAEDIELKRNSEPLHDRFESFQFEILEDKKVVLVAVPEFLGFGIFYHPDPP